MSLHPDFEPEFDNLASEIQDELLARLLLLRQFGPDIGRPNGDTLIESSFPNMKELRFRMDGLRRFAFAFDPHRQAVVLVGGNKEGKQQKAFYRTLISVADRRSAAHVASLAKSKKGS